MPKLFLLDDRPNARIVFLRHARPRAARFLLPVALVTAIGIAIFLEYDPDRTSAPKQVILNRGEAAPIFVAHAGSNARQQPTSLAVRSSDPVSRPGDDVAELQQARAGRFYRDARIARLCAAWSAEQQQLAAAKEKRRGRPPTAAESDAELDSQVRATQTGADTTCPSLGTPDLAQADLQMKEAARLGSPEARYEVLADKLQHLRAEKLASPPSPFDAPALPSQDILNLRSDLYALAGAGNVPAQFLMASTLRDGTLAQSDPQLATAWEMVAIHAPGQEFDIHNLVQYGPYAAASPSEKVALAAAAAAIFQNTRR